MEELSGLDQSVINEWRELGFYYDFDYNASNKQWKFYGSRYGLQKFITLLDEYIKNPLNKTLSEHAHYGPYGYLKIMTWDKPVITGNYIAGSLADFQKLKVIIEEKLSNTKPREVFDIDKDYSVNNTATATFYVMEDDFDPPTIEELIITNQARTGNK